MKKLLCVLLTFALFTSGCCSIFTSGPQMVRVNSKPEGANVTIGPHNGTTPYEISLPRGKDYIITAKYQGDTQTQNLNKSIEGVYWVNILFWPGLIIDVATGKMFKYEPTDYTFDFTN
jgi:hypothetical protein